MSQARFNLKSHRQDPALILLVYRVRGQRLVYSTGLHVALRYWDVARARVKSPHLYRPASAINDTLDRIAKECEVFYAEGMAAGAWDFKQLRRRLDVLTLRATEEQAQTVAEFIRAVIAQREATVKPRTTQTYWTMLTHMEGWQKKVGEVLEFKGLDADFFYSWIEYLRAVPMQGNSVGKNLKKLKTFLVEAENRGIAVPNAYKSGRFRIAATPGTHVYLTEEDLHRIEGVEVDERLDRVRDLLFCGCRTGLRVSDWEQIRSENVRTVDGVKVLEIQPMKTGEPVTIPLHPVVERVLAKYGGALPMISQPKTNLYFKELCRVAGLGKADRVSTHTCRRTFATLAYRAGLPLLMISRITGHQSEKMLLGYIKITATENAIEASKTAFFKSEKGLE